MFSLLAQADWRPCRAPGEKAKPPGACAYAMNRGPRRGRTLRPILTLATVAGLLLVLLNFAWVRTRTGEALTDRPALSELHDNPQLEQIRPYQHMRPNLSVLGGRVDAALRRSQTSAEQTNAERPERGVGDERRPFGFCAALPKSTSARNLPHYVNATTVNAERGYETEFWGPVQFSPVPRYWINTHDPVKQDIYISGNVHSGQLWDSYIWDLFVRVLSKAKPGQLVVDVGANLGYFSLLSAAMGFQVIAFEPMNRNAAKLFSSIIRNGFQERMTLLQNAVTYDPTGRVTMKETHDSNQGNGQIRAVDSSLRGVYGMDYVETITLDGVVQQDVVLLKIDVEGFEGFVLNGARQLICSHIVQFITIEFSSDTRTNPTCRAREMLELLESIGYVISDIVENAEPVPPSRYQSLPPNILFRLLDTSRPPVQRPGAASVCK